MSESIQTANVIPCCKCGKPSVIDIERRIHYYYNVNRMMEDGTAKQILDGTYEPEDQDFRHYILRYVCESCFENRDYCCGEGIWDDPTQKFFNSTKDTNPASLDCYLERRL